MLFNILAHLRNILLLLRIVTNPVCMRKSLVVGLCVFANQTKYSVTKVIKCYIAIEFANLQWSIIVRFVTAFEMCACISLKMLCLIVIVIIHVIHRW